MMICYSVWITYASGFDLSSLFDQSFIAEILVCCLVLAGVVDVGFPAEVSMLTHGWYSGPLGELSSSCSGQLLSSETMLLFAATCWLIASVTPRVFDLLVNMVYFNVYSRTASKTGSPGRSFFSNCLPVNRIDAIIFQVSFLTSLYLNLGRPNFRLPAVNSPYTMCLGRRSMGIRCT